MYWFLLKKSVYEVSGIMIRSKMAAQAWGWDLKSRSDEILPKVRCSGLSFCMWCDTSLGQGYQCVCGVILPVVGIILVFVSSTLLVIRIFLVYVAWPFRCVVIGLGHLCLSNRISRFLRCSLFHSSHKEYGIPVRSLSRVDKKLVECILWFVMWSLPMSCVIKSTVIVYVVN